MHLDWQLNILQKCTVNINYYITDGPPLSYLRWNLILHTWVMKNEPCASPRRGQSAAFHQLRFYFGRKLWLVFKDHCWKSVVQNFSDTAIKCYLATLFSSVSQLSQQVFKHYKLSKTCQTMTSGKSEGNNYLDWAKTNKKEGGRWKIRWDDGQVVVKVETCAK